MKLLIITFLIFLPTLNWAFNCKSVVGKSYYSPGNSEFQYEYYFGNNNIASLNIYTINHSDHQRKKVKKETFMGEYSMSSHKLKVTIKVDGILHKIEFNCLDNKQYMNAGAFSKVLKVYKTLPESHAFSMIDLWPKDSEVIRRFIKNLNKKK